MNKDNNIIQDDFLSHNNYCLETFLYMTDFVFSFENVFNYSNFELNLIKLVPITL